MSIQDQIAIFKKSINAKYPDLSIGYSYDSAEDYYHIWHTNRHLQFKDEEFRRFAGSLIKTCFYSKNIFNFSFGYDYLEDEKVQYGYQFHLSYNKINLNFNEQVAKAEHLYQATANSILCNWSKVDDMHMTIVSSCISFAHQPAGQAYLAPELSTEADLQPEKALAA